jgi:hypothetical protein
VNSSQATTAASCPARITTSGREKITPRIAARRAHVSVWTIYRLMQDRFIEFERPSERKILIYADSLASHLQASVDPEFWDAH